MSKQEVLSYTGSLGLNLLDPVSCRGLFALFALSFDIVSSEASRHRRLTFRFAPGRHARIQQTFIVICGVDRWTDGRTTRVRAPPVCVWELDRRAAGVRTINRLRIWRLLYISARIRFGQKILASFAYSRLCSLVPYKKVRVILLNLVAKC